MTGHRESPAAVYRERLRIREERLGALRRRDGLIANLRLAAAGAGLALVWPALVNRAVAAGWLLVPVLVFAVLAAVHGGVLRRRDEAARAVRFYAAGLARLEDRWVGQGRGGEEFLDPGHPYARDLDLFGPGSLFELLSTARTRPGEATLAAWLLAPAGPAEIAARQKAVAELRGRLDLREELAILGEDVAFTTDPGDVVSWAEGPPVVASPWAPRLAAAAAMLNVAALGAWWLLPYGSLPLVPALALSGGLALAWRRRIGEILGRAGRPERELLLWARMLQRLEAEPFTAARLGALRAALAGSAGSAAERIRRLARLIEWSESRRNVLFAPLAAVLLLGPQLAFAVERWRRRSGGEVGGWLAALGELEALCSLASFASEHPEDAVPRIVEEPCFVATGLGHPLLPAAGCVRNDLRLDREQRLLLVSGSNMSGKSTLLRSVGTNAVLALAGATVRAGSLSLGTVAVGASLLAIDSLQDGTSRFYAEIRRLKQIRDLAEGEAALLFLLDEILHGTNSRDRRIGAEGVIASLLAAGGLGLVTTHDLALAEIADRLAPRAANVHFEDHLEGGRMVFDYRLREGIVERSNALDLMRGLGLEV